VGGLLIAGAVLEAAAGVLGLAGLACCAIAVASFARHRVGQMEVPPTQLAKAKLAQAKAATTAGMGVWRGMSTAGAVPGAGNTPRDVTVLREPASR
jgi:hypothetical protein